MDKDILHETHKSESAFFRIPILLVFIFQISWACTGNQAWADTKEQTKSAPVTQEAQPKVNNTEAFLDAAFNGDIDVVREAVKNGINVDATDQDGRTALMLAGFEGKTDIVRFLLDKGAKIDTRDKTDRTALMYAASGPNMQTVQLLLERKADPNLVDKDEHFSALMFAAAEGHIKVVKILLRHGADKTLKDVDGDRAHDFAQKNGHDEVVPLLASGP